MPFSEYLEYFSPDLSLHPELEIRSENTNSREYLESIVESTHSQLKMLAGAPSVQMQE